jgi:hypothetical protein
MCEEELTAVPEPEGAAPLPIHAFIVPPTATEQQKAGLTELAAKYHVGFIVSVPRNVVEGLNAVGAK